MNILELVADRLLDSFTGFFTVISGDHRYTHEGLGYTYCGKTANLPDSGSAETFQFTTPISRQGIDAHIHMRPPSFSSTASAVEARLAEGSVVSGGTVVAATNNKRTKPNSSVCTLKNAVTLGTEGAVLALALAGASGSTSAIRGGTAGSIADKEIILKPATTYTLTFANLTATDTVVYFELDWYEEKQGA